MEYLHLFNTKIEHDSLRNSNKYKEPWIAYVRDDELITYNKSHDYSLDYLTFEALEDTVFSINFKKAVTNRYITSSMRESFSYSIDNGNTWVTFETPNDTFEGVAITTPTIKRGQKVLWKGIGLQNYTALGDSAYCYFTSTGEFNVFGNIMSLAYGDNFVGREDLENTTDIFSYFFKDCQHLISAKNMILPATTLSNSCYRGMFYGCTALTMVPELPATILAHGCYDSMFQSCRSLTTTPLLPATTLAQTCYRYMFSGCRSLTTAPVLHATTLADNCYEYMFYYCTSLTTAPELPATTLISGCYSNMFSNCTSLTTAPVLPATTLAQTCYLSMFQGCTSLTTAPVLPATTLAQNCYNLMFKGCKILNYIKAMFTTTPSGTNTYNWVSGVASSGTFVKNSAATWNLTGANGIPSGWTIQKVSA